jgi:hypothetical protein
LRHLGSRDCFVQQQSMEIELTRGLHFVLSIICFGAIPAVAMDIESLRAQASAAIATAEFVRKQCSGLASVDEQVFQDLVRRSRLSVAQIRRREEYVDQMQAVRNILASSDVSTVCKATLTIYGPQARKVGAGVIR